MQTRRISYSFVTSSFDDCRQQNINNTCDLYAVINRCQMDANERESHAGLNPRCQITLTKIPISCNHQSSLILCQNSNVAAGLQLSTAPHVSKEIINDRECLTYYVISRRPKCQCDTTNVQGPVQWIRYVAVVGLSICKASGGLSYHTRMPHTHTDHLNTISYEIY